jgi:hypothetical protein
MLKRKISYAMMKTDNREMDLNRKFMNPGSIEKAPEGFTENVMSAVQVESRIIVRKKVWASGKIVPAIVIGVMLFLVIISLFTGTDDKVIPGSEISKFFNHFAIPQIKAPTLPGLNLPGLVVYISLGVFVLWVFDLLLGRLFYRRQ